ncbi:MAG TPA: DegT/DnrJ/EryC1/StrS family aminotransferase, partial [Exilispira sp.]|nr:DegT/DnrJ/EryC1/StrS family aminotransferase [Exilispira sp.]
GSFGDLSIFSFYANKIITTGEGGMIVTDDPEIAEKCRYYRNLCFGKKRFIHDDFGFNYPFTNTQAALGLAQLERLEELVKIKRNIGHTYNQLFKDNPYLQLPIDKNEFANNIYWVYPLVLKENFPHDAEYVMTELQKNGIGTRPFFYPLHLQPILQKMNFIKADLNYPNSRFLYNRGFYIPSGMPLTIEEMRYIAHTINRIVSL